MQAIKNEVLQQIKHVSIVEKKQRRQKGRLGPLLERGFFISYFRIFYSPPSKNYFKNVVVIQNYGNKFIK
jgi:hypothetical protein